jgi:hypothetical protein
MNNSMSRDITLRRDHQSAMGPDGIQFQSLHDKRQWDADSKLVDYQKQIYNLQTSSHFLEK